MKKRKRGKKKRETRKKVVKKVSRKVKKKVVVKTKKIEIQRPNPSKVKEISKNLSIVKTEIAKIIVGQEEIVDGLIMALLCNGHVLLEGVPGIAKTLTIRALGAVTGCKAKRIQFTVDLLPSDITGITTYTSQKGFEIIKGPIFANFLIADEVNRSPPKTQSALLEAMQENQVTIGKTTFQLPFPFFVMATENPLETSGVYSLPEAQIDRFLFKLLMEYPKTDEEYKIMDQNITLRKFEDYNLKIVLSPAQIIKMQELVKKIYLSGKIKNYILKIVGETREKNFGHTKYIQWGASPRASIALFIASKARALMLGRNFVIPKDVKDVCHGVLRHRMILSYKAGAEGVTSDKIIDEILKRTRAP